MSDYIPTTEEVRAGYRRIGGTTWYEGKADAVDAGFDRWLNEVKAQAWEEGWKHDSEYLNTWGQFCPHKGCNPYREYDSKLY